MSASPPILPVAPASASPSAASSGAKRDFLELRDLRLDEMTALFADTRAMKQEPKGTRLHRLRGRSVAVILEKHSTRTRVSFEVGIAQLGAIPVVLGSSDSQLGRGEPIADTARVLARYSDAIVYRTFGHARLREMASATVPVINALSDDGHPVQVLSDVFTMEEVFAARAPKKEVDAASLLTTGKRIAFVGDGSSNMARSMAEAAGLCQFDLVVGCPEAYAPPASAHAAAGGRLKVVHDPTEAVVGADVVHTDVWTSMGQDGDAAARRAAFKGFTVTEALLARAKSDAFFMHCLPAHRGEEVEGAVLDGPRSVVWQQAENRLHVQKALLLFLLGAVLALVGCGGAGAAAPRSAEGRASTTDTARNGQHVAAGSSGAAAEPFVDEALLRKMAETRGFSMGRPRSARPAPDGKSVLFLRANGSAPAQALFEMDVATGNLRELASAETLAACATSSSPTASTVGPTARASAGSASRPAAGDAPLTPEEKARRERLRLHARGLSEFELSDDGTLVLVPHGGKLYVLRRTARPVESAEKCIAHVLPTGEGFPLDPHLSPNGKSVAYVRDHNLCLVATDGASKERCLTKEGTEASPFGVAEFIAQEELGRPRGYFWSPDSTRLLYQATNQSAVERLSIADPAKPDGDAYRPYYPRAGRTNAEVRFGVISVNGGPTVWVDWDRTRFPYVTAVRWPSGGFPTLYVLDRAQRVGQLLALDERTGKTRVLVEERDEAWLEYENSVPLWARDGSGFVWASERSGRWGLEWRDAAGALVRTLTTPDLDVRRVVELDGGNVYFEGSREPTEQEIYSVPVAGGAPSVVFKTRGSGFVTGTRARESDLWVVEERSLDAEVRVLVRRQRAAEWESVLPAVGERAPIVPNVELLRVGADDTRCAVVRPRGFDPKKRYPVIDAAYAGPSVAVVVASRDAYLRYQIVADALDAIVVAVDAKGTPYRGRAWSRAIAGDLGRVPVQGHRDAIVALAARYPQMDLSRVGVFGWSYGGFFSAYAGLAHPDFYRAAVAGAPVVDWRDYDTAYTERYLGLPQENAKAYDRSSPLSLLSQGGSPTSSTERPSAPSRTALLLVHGTADDNVYFLHTLRMAQALDRAGHPYELMPLPGQTHAVSDPDANVAYLRRMFRFFRRELNAR